MRETKRKEDEKGGAGGGGTGALIVSLVVLISSVSLNFKMSLNEWTAFLICFKCAGLT